MSDERLERWLDELLETPGLTAIGSREDGYRVHVEGSLAALPLVARFDGPIVDVGSGGGSPGIPLAAALPERGVTLLEANARKAAFLERIAGSFANVRVIRGRAEEQDVDEYGVAVARALAPPPVAAEWCLPLVRKVEALCSTWGRPPIWTPSGASRRSSGAASRSSWPASSSFPRLRRHRPASRDGPAWRVNVPSRKASAALDDN